MVDIHTVIITIYTLFTWVINSSKKEGNKAHITL